MNDIVHIRINREAHNQLTKLIKKKYRGIVRGVTQHEINQAIDYHCKRLERQLEKDGESVSSL